ncbi:MAG: MBL fold metallo-hydrolase [Sinorhizobium meliloti]|jgi:L-ascorbate metabolism protein UlaG (beta-lactamase superfamily)|uniref:MBL fold metallo-hydrolase n=1 Tax=Sinorhizobium TaxID=28105 RepID=UPI000368FD07|nr:MULTISPECIES: MBL fold metallo-hydrolase [Sinorhizobium]MCG5483598.1 MBL fold metallo-hydrolase [Sinorhizobium meliloti]PND22935.1 Zn-dependent hydrolase [Ensifer sp. MMN_5]PND25688.1 Zn-dependent hydrolase [Sinorhizobium sp. M4_45]RVQ03518.1 Zn-dependent hydrolase [Sinorhizobium meliloti]
MLLRYLAYTVTVIWIIHALWPTPAHAQQAEAHVSQCQAIAAATPAATFASFSVPAATPVASADTSEVTITFLGHSTFLIETPGGVSIATDYNGWFRTPSPPTVVTMNRAHSSHYTLAPDPAIRHVLHGWGDNGEPADHDLVVGDAYIRNVTTDIRSGFEGMERDGNSIFIFEIAGLCIGHLGHLHHELDESHYRQIGRLDVLMVPVDGGLTMGAESMSRVVSRLRSALILPMHRPMTNNFLAMFGDDFDKRFATEPSVKVSLRSLPRRPLIYVLQGV